MSRTGMVALPSFNAVRSADNKPRLKPETETQKFINHGQKPAESIDISATNSSNLGLGLGFGNKKREPLWRCIQNCGACCKLNKGPTFPSPEEIFDDPSDIQQYKSLIGPDGWCIHYEKTTRKCSIYADRPYFCRVEPDIFQTLYGIDKKKFNKEACSCCIDTIKAIYGSKSEELNNFKHAIWETSS
ncbi:uncharacterized protein LOC113775186 [Coffea eugenioides]|uniref:uncharacterized protein LOC113775186 n=1 Tax=Coffea eugenioides TaxID=49369 RepID=UPI000F60AC29|nr:uncharacterized protein LOC113775186 [Coffea eugenioides]XP_027175756.1 uncharacterized protein LOC113775186 [Coffea eugenioides]XP_027175757.1 uncharacterized protein LOC113775186 [Coffea eugenioides]